MVNLDMLLELWLTVIMSLVGCAQYIGELCIPKSMQPCLLTKMMTGRKILVVLKGVVVIGTAILTLQM